tara:strand:- start:354 stop:1139 length:786 start_codon:yes stop_codon:yes gene_type:complete
MSKSNRFSVLSSKEPLPPRNKEMKKLRRKLKDIKKLELISPDSLNQEQKVKLSKKKEFERRLEELKKERELEENDEYSTSSNTINTSLSTSKRFRKKKKKNRKKNKRQLQHKKRYKNHSKSNLKSSPINTAKLKQMEEEQLRFKIEERIRIERKRREFNKYHSTRKKEEEEAEKKAKAKAEFKVKNRMLKHYFESIKEVCQFMEFDNVSSINKSNINKQFRKLSLKYHPDKGGSNKLMQKLTESKNILLDFCKHFEVHIQT